MTQTINTLSDEELMLLEQLCYLNNDVCAVAGVDNIVFSQKETYKLSEVLSGFNEENLQNLRNYRNKDGSNTIGDTYTEGAEWADIIESIKNNGDLRELVISDVKTFEETHHYCQVIDKVTKNPALAICYTNPIDSTDSAIVTFKGTTGYIDWRDNVLALNLTDTERQEDMLNYIEQLGYSDLTVVGHSKGGNYAQFVSILSDKVSRGISMDGQGMSDKFIEANWREIMRNSSKVKNYSVETDFVNQLLYAVPGVQQIYVKGTGIAGILQNHAANSILSFRDNQVSFEEVDGAPQSLQRIRQFSTYIMKIATPEDRERISELFSDIAGRSLGGEDKYKKGFADTFLTDREALVATAAYFIKFVETYDLSLDDVGELLADFGLVDKNLADFGVGIVEIVMSSHRAKNFIIDATMPEVRVARRIFGQVASKSLLLLLQSLVDEYIGEQVNINSLLDEIEDKVRSIPTVDIASLMNGIERLGVVMDEVRLIQISPDCFDNTCVAMGEQLDKLESEHANLNDVFSRLLDAWIGNDQKVFQEVSKNLQDELQYRIQETNWLLDRIQEAKERFIAQDEHIASSFSISGSMKNKSYGELLRQAQEAISLIGGGL